MKQVKAIDNFFAVVFAVILLVIFTCVGVANAQAEEYPACGIVTKIDQENDIIYFTDFYGEVWSFYGIEDWAIGDIVAAIMEDMGTSSIYDDMIIKVQYAGWVIWPT